MENKETALEVKETSTQSALMMNAFQSAESFGNAQRMAKLLCASKLVPQSFQGNVPDCVIAIEMASRIGASPMAVMQNLYIVHGKPAWSSQFLIACINACGRFSPLRYLLSGDGDYRACVAWATDRSGERLESPSVSIAMAKAEGWYSKNGSKWQTMPDLMLRYRAATFFARTYAPELTMGIRTQEEEAEIINVTPAGSTTSGEAKIDISDYIKESDKQPTPTRVSGVAERSPLDPLVM